LRGSHSAPGSPFVHQRLPAFSLLHHSQASLVAVFAAATSAALHFRCAMQAGPLQQQFKTALVRQDQRAAPLCAAATIVSELAS